ncbi:2-oxoisovalerate dehydrogenase [Trichothermofontia sichuanensis B231]|jgi:predicted RNase H-like HicB family nuclease|uniref:2-oxoisovalerate dehydrogenase n=1 Tax=Trichothermofontia sichuanensis TaxID=3045816 RepID=UPI002246BF0E|nr:2-oxoisovalerate dehydrogenase [Trichothermofontia sichuanensis]UZQ53693.1 2-oxoisovalerate dehydrogenase [Trichothermofontia sichuanensis B231]
MMTSQPIGLASSKIKEIIFVVEEDAEGGYIAQALGESIFTQADDLDSLRSMIKDALECHFPNPEERPQLIRLHIVRDEVFAL